MYSSTQRLALSLAGGSGGRETLVGVSNTEDAGMACASGSGGIEGISEKPGRPYRDGGAGLWRSQTLFSACYCES